MFRDLDDLDIVGIFPNYETAYAAWKSAAQRTVDNAVMRYFIVHLHRLLQPEAGADDLKIRIANVSERATEKDKSKAVGLRLDEASRALLARFMADWVWPRWRELLSTLVLTGFLAAATGGYPTVIKLSFDTLMKGAGNESAF